MGKTAVLVTLAVVATVVALRLLRSGESGVVAGQWRELRPRAFE